MRVIVAIIVTVALLKLLVWWLEPRMAFYPYRGVQETPAAMGLPFVNLQIPTADGETLHAWWLEHPAPRAQVIFWHGNGGNLSVWLDVIAGLRQHGFSVLAVDYRGYGNSTGTPSERGLYSDADASLALFGARLSRGRRPVIYWGRSIGSPVAAYAASKAPPDAVVLESPFPQIRAILEQNPVLWTFSFLSSYRFPTSRYLQQYGGSLLVIHGDADSIIPYGAGRAVFERAPGSRKFFVTIAGADHNDLHLVNPRLYWDSIDAFVRSIGV